MAALATIPDVETRLGRSVTDTAELARIAALLDDASATVRSYTGQQFTKATTTDRLKVVGGKVRLPQKPVESVTQIDDVNGNTLTHTWDGGQFVHVTTGVPDTWAWEPYRHGVGHVDATYTHGYNTVPDDIVGVVSQIVVRSFGVTPGSTGFTQESIGEYSYQVGTIAASGAAGLMNDERVLLDRYRAVGGVVWAH